MLNKKYTIFPIIASCFLHLSSYGCIDEAKLHYTKEVSFVKNKKNEGTNMLNDINITAAMKKKLFEDPDINGFRVHVTTDDGVVTLTGTVTDEAIKEKLTSIAEGINGVREVINKIDIGSKYIASDAGITTLIKFKLLENPYLSGFDVHVETINGIVTFTGIVPDRATEEEVKLIGRMTRGVKEVHSKLEISDSKLKSAAQALNDSIITANIKMNYMSDQHLDALSIHIKTINGKVILKGVVPSEVAKQRAIAIANLTYGVKEVESKLEVK